MTDKKTHKKSEKIENNSCADIRCPFHGELSMRGRTFEGTVIKKFPKRICIEFERTIYVPKFERYTKKKTKIHAKLPDCIAEEINIGDYVEIKECRQLSKIINFVVMKKIRGPEKTGKIGGAGEKK